MNVDKLIAELKEYKAQIDEAIGVLERLQLGRGQPSTRAVSPETKKKMADAQRKRWSKYHKQKNRPGADQPGGKSV